MDSLGNLALRTRALSEPPWAPQANEFQVNPMLGLRALLVPSAPLIFPLFDHSALVPRTRAIDHAPQSLNAILMVDTQGKSILTEIPVTRVYTDQNMMTVLYKDA